MSSVPDSAIGLSKLGDDVLHHASTDATHEPGSHVDALQAISMEWKARRKHYSVSTSSRIPNAEVKRNSQELGQEVGDTLPQENKTHWNGQEDKLEVSSVTGEQLDNSIPSISIQDDPSEIDTDIATRNRSPGKENVATRFKSIFTEEFDEPGADPDDPELFQSTSNLARNDIGNRNRSFSSIFPQSVTGTWHKSRSVLHSLAATLLEQWEQIKSSSVFGLLGTPIKRSFEPRSNSASYITSHEAPNIALYDSEGLVLDLQPTAESFSRDTLDAVKAKHNTHGDDNQEGISQFNRSEVPTEITSFTQADSNAEPARLTARGWRNNVSCPAENKITERSILERGLKKENCDYPSTEAFFSLKDGSGSTIDAGTAGLWLSWLQTTATQLSGCTKYSSKMT
ncbi:uncharacterized protein IL334_001633 [Kwoniella shivajii]|uniref:Uncharacterized protein n=1 Tax=Kwoniella shivajii TaxID=564305 RepID=A0ABZ1CU32_9TREE|nr:hypothetical protein IL334_001633 [Kwoniella shivajii]